MPRFVQYLTYINPLRYFITVVREIYLKGTEFRFLWKEASAMALIGVFTIVSAAIRFHKRVT
jgi:ABC-2 type transport system permease protein